MTKLEAQFLEDAYPGCDFWEIEKSYSVKVTVIAEAETPEEEPSESFSRSVMDKKHIAGKVELPEELDYWLEDYFKRKPEAEAVFEDMCKELCFKVGGQVAVGGAIKGGKKKPPTDKINKLLDSLGLNEND